MVKPRKLKFVLTIRINESLISANFGDPTSSDCELRQKKKQILAWKVINSLITQNLLDLQTEI